MRQWKKIVACIELSMGLMLSSMGIMVPPGQAEAEEQPAGYLAVYVAAYENNMGVEHAQFPSGNLYGHLQDRRIILWSVKRRGSF